MSILVKVRHKSAQILRFLFGDKIYGWGGYQYYKFKQSEHIPFFQNQKNIVIQEPVPDLFFLQCNKEEDSFYEFALYDGIVRFLAVAEYYGENQRGFSLYNKMNLLAGARTDVSVKKQRKRNDDVFPFAEMHTEQIFKDLIRSYEQNGYDASKHVEFDRKGLLMNGCHRFSLALYRNQEFISVRLHRRKHQRRWVKTWFWSNGFSTEDIGYIEETRKKIEDVCREKIGAFYFIIFPPAKYFFDKITQDIKNIDKQNIEEVEYQDFVVNWEEFVGLVKGLYAFDNISEKTLREKLEYIYESSEIKENKVVFRVISARIKNMDYRLKPENGLPQSFAIIKYKKAIRERYASEIRKNPKTGLTYNHDIIIHSTDNYISNEAYRILNSFDRDLSKLFENICGLSYAVMLTGKDKMGEDFPLSFYINEDIDFFVLEKDLIAIIDETLQFCEERFSSVKWITVEKRKSRFGYQVSVLMRGFRIIMFDFHTSYYYISETVLEQWLAECNSERGFKALNLKQQLQMRVAKYTANPSKKQHADYIKKNYKDMEEIDISCFCEKEDIQKCLRKIYLNN